MDNENPSAIRKIDAVVLAVAHEEFRYFTVQELDELYKSGQPKVLVDIKGILDRSTYESAGYSYWRL